MLQSLSETQAEIISQCDRIKELLLAKNAAYGNSVTDPIRIFSKASTVEQINVRIDDKLSRLMRGVDTQNVPEETEDDLIGYLLLKKVVKALQIKDTDDRVGIRDITDHLFHMIDHMKHFKSRQNHI
jgi:hypothetical protein